jgi:murein endopeptidase
MNPWLMGLLAAAVSALAGAGATSWWESELEQEDEHAMELSAQADVLPAPDAPIDQRWLGRSAPPVIDVVHPLAALDDQEVEELVLQDPTSLGSMSIGAPNRGALVNGIQFPPSPFWQRTDPLNSWGTRESVEFVEHAIRRVNEQFPNTPVLFVGDFSPPKGGKVRPHKSHQSGRDVDLGYYYNNDSAWYLRASSRNLDRARTWALLETLLRETRVQYVFMDRMVQTLLKEYALAHGEDPEWLSRIFDGAPGKDSVVRHRAGHATHMHVRFENPTAEVTARRSYAALRKARLISKMDYYADLRTPKRARAAGLADP